MAYYETSNAKYKSLIRKLLASDLAHADVLNQTISQLVLNGEALKAASSRIGPKVINADSWKDGLYRIYDSSVKLDSIVEVYYSPDSKEIVLNADITERLEDGAIVFIANDSIDGDIAIDCIEVRNEVMVDAD